jgi:hypothetical protein
MSKINIPKDDLPALKLLSEWPEPAFQSLVTALKASKPKLTARQFMAQVTQTVAEIPKEQVIAILKLLFGVYSLRQRTNAQVNEFAQGVGEAAIETHPADFSAEKTKTLTARLQILLEFSNLGVAIKASDILTEHNHVFCGARILSDIRPVFAEQPNAASASVIIHNLQIGFHDSGTGAHREFYVALDTGDLGILKKVLARAEQKTLALKAMLEKANVPYVGPET